mgnify:FL=1
MSDSLDYIRVDIATGDSMTSMFCTRCGRDAYLVLSGDPYKALAQMEDFMEAHKDCRPMGAAQGSIAEGGKPEE